MEGKRHRAVRALDANITIQSRRAGELTRFTERRLGNGAGFGSAGGEGRLCVSGKVGWLDMVLSYNGREMKAGFSGSPRSAEVFLGKQECSGNR